MALGVKQRLGGAQLKTLRGMSGPNVQGLLAPSSLQAGPSLHMSLYAQIPRVHFRLFTGMQFKGMRSVSSLEGKFNALRTIQGTYTVIRFGAPMVTQLSLPAPRQKILILKARFVLSLPMMQVKHK